MVAGGKAEVTLLNKYIKNYEEVIFGLKPSVSKSSNKEDLYKNMLGFKEVFKEKVTFKAKIGDKIETIMDNMSLEDLLKSGKK